MTESTSVFEAGASFCSALHVPLALIAVQGIMIPVLPLLFLAAPLVAGYALYRVFKAPKGHDLAVSFAIVGLLASIALAAFAIGWIWTDFVNA